MAGSNLSVLVLLLPTLLIACVGIATIVRGWRGRRVGDHPHCRHCGFDLFGSPEPSVRCPECGADLTKPRARVTGKRRRQPVRVAAGVALLICAIGFGWLVGGPMLKSIQWGKFRPTWYALREARGSLPGDREGAIWVLIDRADRNVLSATERASLASTLVALDGDPSAPWSDLWSGWLDEEIVAGRLTADERQAFCRAATIARPFAVRPVVRFGDPIPVEFGLSRSVRPLLKRRQTGYMPTSDFDLELRQDDCVFIIDGQMRASPVYATHSTFAQDGWAGMECFSRLPIRPDAMLAPGVHSVTLHALARLSLKDHEIARVPIDGTATVEVLPPGRDDLTHVSDASLQSRVMAAVELRCRLESHSSGHRGSIDVACDSRALPAAIACRVLVSQGSVQQKGDWVLLADAHQGGATGIDFDSTGMTDAPLDVRLIPDDDAARATLDLFRVWSSELVFHNVPATRR